MFDHHPMEVYTQGVATVEELPPLVPTGYVSGSVRGEWTRRTAGGCSNSVPGFHERQVDIMVMKDWQQFVFVAVVMKLVVGVCLGRRLLT